jgi:Zn-dependent metalloprotease
MFYIALTQQLSPQSRFSDSRRGVVLAARSLFRKLPQADIDKRVHAIEAGFDAAEITETESEAASVNNADLPG